MRGGGIAPTQPLIAVNGLRKEYAYAGGGRVLALDNVSFDLPAGEFLAMVGPSGCGKTTLLRMIAGLQPRSGGRVALDGTAGRGPSDDIGVVFQEPVLLPWRTVFENVMLPLEVHRHAG